MEKLNFLGHGGAFDDCTNSSAYLEFTKDGKKQVLFIDMGANVFEKAKELIMKNRYSAINVAITHLHSDHVGSLSSLIFFCHFVLRTKLTVLCGDKVKEGLVKLLEISGNKPDQYAVKSHRTDLEIDEYEKAEYVKMEIFFIPTDHVPEIPTYGILITKSSVENAIAESEFKKSIYFSADSRSIPLSVQELLLKNRIEHFYQDITLADYPGNVHYNIDKFICDLPMSCVDSTNFYFYHNAFFDPNEKVDILSLKPFGNKCYNVDKELINLLLLGEIYYDEEKCKLKEGLNNDNEKIIIMEYLGDKYIISAGSKIIITFEGVIKTV
ncbi:MAG: MBL fold metallo-hydrolase [Cetobacterium sp.]